MRLVKREQFVPFGFGRRVCMGEALAKDTLLIFFATLVKQLRSFFVAVFAEYFVFLCFYCCFYVAAFAVVVVFMVVVIWCCFCCCCCC